VVARQTQKGAGMYVGSRVVKLWNAPIAALWVIALVCTSIYVAVSRADDASPTIPLPRGLVEASGLLPQLRTSALAKLPSTKTLLGIYYTLDSVTAMLDHGYSEPATNGRATLSRQATPVRASEEFLSLKEAYRKDSGRRFDPEDPAIQRILRRYELVGNGKLNSPSIAVGGVSPLGFTVDKANEFAVSMIASYTWSDGQTSAPMVFAMSTGIVLLNTDQIELTIVVPYQGASSVTAANSMMADWMHNVRRVNGAK
jgi:hypothetical protein